MTNKTPMLEARARLTELADNAGAFDPSELVVSFADALAFATPEIPEGQIAENANCSPEMPEEVREMVERLRELLAKASPGPWGYRSVEFDDWGFIRSAPDSEGRRWVVATARAGGPLGVGEELTHREQGTDPYGPNAALIVEAINALPDLLTLLSGEQSGSPASSQAQGGAG